MPTTSTSCSPSISRAPAPTAPNWYVTFVAIGRIEPMALTSELSIRFLRPAQGERLWARADLATATRRSVVGSVSVWMDDNSDRPTAVAQGTYVLPRTEG